MSETYYIKHTSFDDINGTLVENEANSFIIGPGELNGPLGSARDSDLELYGFGVLKWGEGVNQNLFRLLEGWACPQKEDGDFLPGTDTANGFVPGTGSYVATGSPASAMLPKDERDLGTGNGITTPLLGMRWFNTTDDHTYEYKAAGWVKVGYELEVDLTTHINDSGLHITPDQNVFLDGLDLPTLTSAEVNTLKGISLVLGGGTVQGQLDLMVEKAGDTMTGSLTMSGGARIFVEQGSVGAPSIAFNETATDTGIYSQGEGYINFTTNGVEKVGIRPNGVIFVNPSLNYETLITADDEIPNRQYCDNTYINAAGDTMTGQLNVPVTPTSSAHATSKSYVDGKIQATHTYHFYTGSNTLIVPDNVYLVYVTLCGGGQGGQGGGDGGSCSSGGQTNQGGTSYVISNVERVYAEGGYSVMTVSSAHAPCPQPTEDLGDGRVYYYRWFSGVGWIKNLVPMMYQLGSQGTGGNTAPGGNGGNSMFGYGGRGSTAEYPFGTANSGYRGGGGAGGSGQDSLSGAGGASGYGAVSVPLRCTPGSTLTIVCGAGSAGSSGCRATGGTGGTGVVLISF